MLAYGRPCAAGSVEYAARKLNAERKTLSDNFDPSVSGTDRSVTVSRSATMPSIHTRIFQVAALACAAGLAACASVTPYQPASKGYGTSEQRIAHNRFRINLARTPDQTKQTVEHYQND